MFSAMGGEGRHRSLCISLVSPASVLLSRAGWLSAGRRCNQCFGSALEPLCLQMKLEFNLFVWLPTKRWHFLGRADGSECTKVFLSAQGRRCLARQKNMEFCRTFSGEQSHPML